MTNKRPKKGEKGYTAPKKPLPAFVPFNRDGTVRTSTALTEGGIFVGVTEPTDGKYGSPLDYATQKKYGHAVRCFGRNMNPLNKATMGGKLFALGVAAKLIAAKKRIGILRGN